VCFLDKIIKTRHNTAGLWDLSAKDPAANPIVLRRHDGLVSSVAISPDNHRVVTGSWDKTARLWVLKMNDLVDLARTIVGRNFVADEWQLYFPGEKYRKTFPDVPGPDIFLQSRTGKSLTTAFPEIVAPFANS
jgi:WD40 repeat protein